MRAATEVNGFTLEGKGAGHYFFLFLACLSVGAVLTVGCLFGFGEFTIDWSGGAVTFKPIALELFGAMVEKTGVLSPWQIGFGVPVFAIWFLLSRSRRRGNGSANATDNV